MAVLTASSVSNLRALVPDFERSLRAANKSSKTVQDYGDATRGLIRFLLERGMRIEATNVRREHIEAYLEDQVAQWKPATANQRYRSLMQLFKYLVEEGEVRDSPMAKMKPPKLAEVPVPVLPEGDVRRLLASATGKGFQERRDTAMMRLLMDTGMRADEVVGSESSTSTENSRWRSSSARAVAHMRVRTATRTTSCVWLVGGPDRCSSATPPQPPRRDANSPKGFAWVLRWRWAHMQNWDRPHRQRAANSLAL